MWRKDYFYGFVSRLWPEAAIGEDNDGQLLIYTNLQVVPQAEHLLERYDTETLHNEVFSVDAEDADKSDKELWSDWWISVLNVIRYQIENDDSIEPELVPPHIQQAFQQTYAYLTQLERLITVNKAAINAAQSDSNGS